MALRLSAGRARRAASLGALLLVVGLPLSACSDESSETEQKGKSTSSQEAAEPTAQKETTQPGTDAPAESAVTVTMRYAVLKPKEVNIKVGEAVTWHNNDTETHGPLYVYKDGDKTNAVASRTGPLLVNGKWTQVFDEPGKYLFVDKGTALDVTLEQWITVSE